MMLGSAKGNNYNFLHLYLVPFVFIRRCGSPDSPEPALKKKSQTSRKTNGQERHSEPPGKILPFSLHNYHNFKYPLICVLGGVVPPDSLESAPKKNPFQNKWSRKIR